MKVYYAPVLPSEGWTSIDRYRQDYETFMPRWYPEVNIQSVLPSEDQGVSGWRRRALRDLSYPMKVARRGCGGTSQQTPLHIFDHSYSHLVPRWELSILHCRDLNHLVMPSLTGFALRRWKQRLQGMRKAEAVIAISQQLSDELQEYVGISEERIRVIHHGVDLECFRPDRKEEAQSSFPQLAALAKTHFLVLNIGTNLPRKNLETIYGAVRAIKEKGHAVKLVRIGTNESRSGEDARIASYGVSEDVIQMGVLNADQVAQVCNICHALSFASRYEGFGRPLLEGQACGLPLVAAQNSCIPEIAGDGALYHEPESSEHLQEQLEKVLHGAEEVTLARKAAFANTERFHWKAHLDQVVSLYKEVAS